MYARTSLLLAWGAALLLPSGATIAQEVYWVDNDLHTVNAANLDGSDQQVLFTAPGSLVGLAADLDGGKLYWVENSIGLIRRANFDGSDVEVVFGGGAIDFIDFDPVSRQIYWGGQGIRRADADGTNAEMILTKDQAWSEGIAVDGINGLIFYVVFSGIDCAGLDGSNPQRVLSSKAYSLCADPESKKLYVADWYNDRIYSVNYDGTGQQDLVTDQIRNPRDVTLYGNKLYWTEASGSPSIRRCDLDGSNVETVFYIESGEDPIGIVVVPEPASLSLLALGGLAILHRRRQNP